MRFESDKNKADENLKKGSVSFNGNVRNMKKLVFGILIIAMFCFGANKTFAQCSCMPKLTLQDHFQRSDVVFVGKVVEVEKTRQTDGDSYEVAIKFEVKQTWKKDLERFVVLKELYVSGNGFEQDAEWLLYAFKGKDGTLQIARGCCSRTKPLSIANKQGDLKAFKQMGEKPKTIVESKMDNATQ